MHEQDQDRSDAPAMSVDKEQKGWVGTVVGTAFFGIFLVVGAGMSYFFFVKPLLNVLDARGWQEVPCTIVSSRVKQHNDSDGSTYSVEITFDYQVGGEQFRSDRYKFMSSSSSGRSGKQAVVDQYPPGQQAVCFVDPNDHSQAVIERGMTLDMLLGLIPLLFFAVGLGGVLAMVGVIKIGTSQKGQMAWRPEAARPKPDEYGSFDVGDPYAPLVLQPEKSRWGRLIGITFAALFWNGIVSVFAWEVIDGFQQGQPSWFLTIFLIPFVLVGLLLIVGVPHAALMLLNPKLTLTLHPGTVRLGETTALNWSFDGSTRSIRTFQIRVTAREEAQYRRGTSTYTDKETFFEETLIETNDPLTIAQGEVELSVPSGAMHSFEAEHNKIIWTIEVKGEIAFWPDVDNGFQIAVMPHHTGQEAFA